MNPPRAFLFSIFLSALLSGIVLKGHALDTLEGGETFLEFPQGNYEDKVKEQDPLEPLNRGIFSINTFLDGLFFKPFAYMYQDFVHEEVRDSVSNFFNNLASPITFFNDILQLEPQDASNTFARFLINTTIGVLGFFDAAATIFDIQPKKKDFGQTFRKWHIPAGPYLVLPILGPSTVRDLGSTVVEAYVDPYNMYMRRHHRRNHIYVRTGIELLAKREKLLKITDKLDKADDPYSAYRNLYLQNRKIIEVPQDSPVPEDVVEDDNKEKAK